VTTLVVLKMQGRKKPKGFFSLYGHGPNSPHSVMFVVFSRKGLNVTFFVTFLLLRIASSIVKKKTTVELKKVRSGRDDKRPHSFNPFSTFIRYHKNVFYDPQTLRIPSCV